MNIAQYYPSESEINNRYERRLAALRDLGQKTDRISTVVEKAIENLSSGRNHL